MLKVLIADDYQPVHRGLRMTIDIEKDMQVVDEANNGVHVLNLIRKHKPDVILFDLQMSKMDGVEVQKQARPEFPDLPILNPTTFNGCSFIFNLVRGRERIPIRTLAKVSLS